MVKIPSSNARGMGLVPGLRPKVPHVVGYSKNFFKKKNPPFSTGVVEIGLRAVKGAPGNADGI